MRDITNKNGVQINTFWVERCKKKSLDLEIYPFTNTKPEPLDPNQRETGTENGWMSGRWTETSSRILLAPSLRGIYCDGEQAASRSQMNPALSVARQSIVTKVRHGNTLQIKPLHPHTLSIFCPSTTSHFSHLSSSSHAVFQQVYVFTLNERSKDALLFVFSDAVNEWQNDTGCFSMTHTQKQSACCRKRQPRF